MNEQERLMALMQAEGMNAKEFAAEVGISAATMSNIINGRNNPSLEVMQKVLNRFRNVSTNWLILGVGSMYSEKIDSQEDKNADNNPADTLHNNTYARACKSANQGMITPASLQASKDSAQDSFQSSSLDSKQVTKVLVFYSDGTFDELVKQSN